MKKKLIAITIIMLSIGALSAQIFSEKFLKYNATGINNRIHPDFIDYDGDGKLDVIGGFESRIDFLQFKNEGSSFSINVLADSVLGYPMVEAIDFNNDGFTDFVAVINNNSANEDIYLYLNDGNYNYDSYLMFPSQGDEVEKIEIADMDADGDLDLIVDFYGNINALVYVENNGSTIFSWSFITFSGQPTSLYGVRDMNGDGLPDIVASHYNFSTNLYDLLAVETDTSGSTSFSNHTISSYNYYSVGLIENFVGTNLPDILVPPHFSSSTSNSCTIWQNNGNFNFTNVSQPQLEPYSLPFLAKDYDNDGDMDFLSSGGAGNNQGIWIASNNGSGSFSNSLLIPEQLNEPIDWVDFNNDSLNDLLFSGQGEVSMYTQNTDGTYSKFWTNTDNGSKFVNVFDIDNNGLNDIIIADYVNLNIHKQSFDEKLLSAEIFNHAVTPSLSQISGMINLDKDNDGDLDMLVSSTNGMYWFNNSLGNLSVQPIAGGLIQASGFEVTDFDQDGNPDIVLIENGIKRLEWNGASFSTTSISNGSDKKTILDIDSDGDMDIAFIDYNISSGNYVLKSANYANNSFSIQIIIPNIGPFIGNQLNNSEEVISASDIDSDGDTDLLLMNYGLGKVVWLRNDGGLNFVPITLTDTILSPKNIETGDLDNDGDMDILISSDNWGKIIMFSNNGNQVFSESIVTNKAGLIENFKVIDFDNDGDLDCIINSKIDNKMLLLDNILINCPRSYEITNSIGCQGDSVLLAGNYYIAPSINYDTTSTILGCDSINIYKIRAYAPVTPSIILDTICMGDSVQFGGVFYYNTGLFSDSLVNGNGCDSIIQLNLKVYSIPTVIISQDTNKLSVTSNLTNYQWYKNGAVLINEVLSEIDAGQYGDGLYFLIGVTNDGCTVLSDSINFVKTIVGIESIFETARINIFPNPVHDKISINCNFNTNQIKGINLYLVDGKNLAPHKYRVSKDEKSIQINLKTKLQGYLLLEIILENQIIKSKIMVY